MPKRKNKTDMLANPVTIIVALICIFCMFAVSLILVEQELQIDDVLEMDFAVAILGDSEASPPEPCPDLYFAEKCSNITRNSAAKLFSEGNPDETLCECLDDNEKDGCYLQYSMILNDSSGCRYISSEARSDLCYMHFINMMDYSHCDLLHNEHIKRSCQAMRSLQY